MRSWRFSEWQTWPEGCCPYRVTWLGDFRYFCLIHLNIQIFASVAMWATSQPLFLFNFSTLRLDDHRPHAAFCPIVIHLKGGCYQLRTVFEPYGLRTRSSRTGTCRKQTASYCENYLNFTQSLRF